MNTRVLVTKYMMTVTTVELVEKNSVPSRIHHQIFTQTSLIEKDFIMVMLSYVKVLSILVF